jgi:hypothetical protein
MKARLAFALSFAVGAGTSLFACVGEDPIGTTPPPGTDAGAIETPDATASADAMPDPIVDSGPTGADAGPLDLSFGTNGVATLEGVALAMTVFPGDGGGIVWADTKGGDAATQVVVHTLTDDGKPGPTPPGPTIAFPRLSYASSETPRALLGSAQANGTPLLVAGGSFDDTSEFPGGWARSFRAGTAYEEVTGASFGYLAGGQRVELSSIAFDPTALQVAAALTLTSDTGPSAVMWSSAAGGGIIIRDAARAAAITRDPNAASRVVGAAIATDGQHPAAVRRAKMFEVSSLDYDTTWNGNGDPVLVGPAAGVENVGLLGLEEDILVTGFSAGGKTFFQRIDKEGHAKGALAELAVTASTVHFAGAVKIDQRVYVAGCVDSPARAWVGAFVIDPTPALDGTFASKGELLLSDASGACVKAIAADHGGRLVLLVGARDGTGADRIVRVRR